MRALLLTDTHGDLDAIGTLASRTSADLVVHAGDFGFHDQGSPDRLSDREIRLRIVHSGLPGAEKDRLVRLPAEDQRRIVRDQLPLSQLPHYLRGERRFEVPVYAVWGNHEDAWVIERFRDGTYRVENLHLLDERATCRAGPFHLFGLGGNVLVSRKIRQRPIAGGSGRVWSTLSQFAELIDTVRTAGRADGEVRVLVTHVSPGKEPLVARLAALIAPDFAVSGHMAPPWPTSWTEFGIREPAESAARLDRALEDLRAASCGDPALEALRTLPSETVHLGRGERAPAWYRNICFLNLPDVGDGHAILEVGEGGIELETRSRRPAW